MPWTLLLACSAPDAPAPVEAPAAPVARPAGPPDVLLVSLDTTRADALSAWGRHPGTTPRLDALAAGGVRFAWAVSTSPTTLASHSAVFTGLDAHQNAIPRNGYPLAESAETLAERFRAAGWYTTGVLGSTALARPMGVDQGFDAWDEAMDLSYGTRHERRAADVTDAALAALAARPDGRPVFAFVHYYDAHQPYGAPEPWTHRWSDPAYAGRFPPTVGTLRPLAQRIRLGAFDPKELDEVVATYLGEVSYVDEQLGRLLDRVDLARTVVVVFADHGDMFGEDRKRPFGHGADLDLAVTHVPLIVAGPGVPAGRVVETPVSLQDLGATVLGLAGLPTGLGEARDLSPLWAGGTVPAAPRFMEATQPAPPRAVARWNNAHTERGVLDGDTLLLRAPWLDQPPALYRVAEGQPPLDDPARLAAGVAALEAWDAQAPPYREVAMSPETVEGLRALGYVE